MQEPFLLLPKLEAKSSHIFTQSLLDVTFVCGIERFTCQDEFFLNNPLDVKKMNMLLTFFSSPVSLFFGLGEFLLFHSNTPVSLWPWGLLSL
jgi:hypothetical protein